MDSMDGSVGALGEDRCYWEGVVRPRSLEQQ